MRRLSSVLLVLLLTTTVFAQNIDGERQRELPGPGARLGRAMILSPTQPLDDADRRHLATNGISVSQPLSEGRYLVRVRDGAALDDARIASIEPLTAEKKIHPTARRAARMGSKRAEVHVIFQKDVTFEDARAAILSAGASMRRPFALGFAPSQRITAIVPPAALDALAADERVLTLMGAPRLRVRTHNAASAALSKVNVVHAAPYGLSGAGVTMSLFELAEAQATHPEFGGRLTVNAKGGSQDDKMHATHVAGTMAASGVNPEAKGMAPAARIHQFCVPSSTNDCEDDWLEIKDKTLESLGVSIDNNSWGYILGWDSDGGVPVWDGTGAYFGAYWLLGSAPIDEISIKRNILFVHSAGNEARGASFGGSEWNEHRHADDDGEVIKGSVFCYSKNASGTDCPTSICNGGCEAGPHQPNLPYETMGVTASAKNVITVGAVATFGGPIPDVTDFSSRGPALDGRVKPEVVARGLGVLSTVLNNGYSRLQGTSMAGPAVSGIAALLVEQWRKLNSNANPSPEQLKALLIAGARDLGNAGPDYTYGFGLVDAKASVDTIIADGGRGDRIRNFTFTQPQGQSFETTVTISEPQTLRFVLNWPDPAIPYLGGEDDIAQKALVNDLDLKVIDGAGTTHLPYVLNKGQMREPATRGVNTVDNVEMVEIANAPAGTYRVVATGTKVTEGPQKAVLVSSAQAGPLAAPCRDPQEVNNRTNETPQTAVGPLVSNSLVRGALCSATDLDYYSFTATKAGAVTISLAARDTPVRATLTGNGVNTTVDVPANSIRTLTANAATVPLALMLRIETAGAIGTDSSYSFTPLFGQTAGTRRRSSRH